MAVKTRLGDRLLESGLITRHQLDKALEKHVSTGQKLGKIAQPLRAALTGRTTSPGIFDVLLHLGQGESIARIDDQLEPTE